MLFTSENLLVDGMYIHYRKNDYDKPMFVARLKHQKKDNRRFKKFLIENFTVEEYFLKMTEGYSPLEIVEQKGFISSNIKRVLKSVGYPETPAAYRQYKQDRMREYEQGKVSSS